MFASIHDGQFLIFVAMWKFGWVWIINPVGSNNRVAFGTRISGTAAICRQSNFGEISWTNILRDSAVCLGTFELILFAFSDKTSTFAW